MDNGLCYYPETEYFDRSTCTDPDWGSDVCRGNEALLQCPARSDKWCCNGNGACSIAIEPLPDESAQRSADASDPVGPIASSATETLLSPPETTSEPVIDSYYDPTGGDIVVTGTETPTAYVDPGTVSSFSSQARSSSSPPRSSSSPARSSSSPPRSPSSPAQNDSLSTGTIVGIAVGIIVFFILAAIILFSLWRRRKRRPTAASAPSPASPPLEAKFSDPTSPGTNVSGIDGTPVVHSRERFSELPATEVSPPSSWRGSMGAVPGAGGGVGGSGSVSGGAPSLLTSPGLGIGRIAEDAGAGAGAVPPSSPPQELEGTPVAARKAPAAFHYTAYREGYQPPPDADVGAGEKNYTAYRQGYQPPPEADEGAG